MRHAPLEFADQIADLKSLGHTWDSVFCTDMRDVAAFKGLTDLGSIPITVYFHENQFAYPNRRAAEADLHFAFTNFTTLVAADRVWFNSQFNLDATMDGAQRLLKRFPIFGRLVIWKRSEENRPFNHRALKFQPATHRLSLFFLQPIRK